MAKTSGEHMKRGEAPQGTTHPVATLPDRPDHTLGPLPPDPRESLRGWLGSIIMGIIAVVVVAALTWGVLNWREAQVQQEAAQEAPQEQPARLA